MSVQKILKLKYIGFTAVILISSSSFQCMWSIHLYFNNQRSCSIKPVMARRAQHSCPIHFTLPLSITTATFHHSIKDFPVSFKLKLEGAEQNMFSSFSFHPFIPLLQILKEELLCYWCYICIIHLFIHQHSWVINDATLSASPKTLLLSFLKAHTMTCHTTWLANVLTWLSATTFWLIRDHQNMY